MSESQDMSAYLGIFMDEGQEQLTLLEQEVLRMERGDHSVEILQSMFRAAHTLKGSSRAMGFLEIGELTHQMENVLDDLRNGQLCVDTAIINALLDCLDALTALMASVADHGNDTSSGRDDIGGLISRLDEIRGGQAASELTGAVTVPNAVIALNDAEASVAAQAYADGKSIYSIDVVIASDCAMKAVRAFMVIGAIQPLGEIVRTLPADKELEDEAFDGRISILFATDLGESAVEILVADVPEVATVTVAAFDSPTVASTESEATKAADVEQQSTEDALPTTVANRSGAEETIARAVVHAAKPQDGGQTIRVGLGRLDSLLNLVGELVIDRTQILQLAQSIRERHGNDQAVIQLSEAVSRVSRITSELQEQVMKTRMLPIDGVFQRMPRMVRDLAQKTGKEIDFQMSGGETELDRSVIEVLGDPLIHILRNSLDHGIEPGEERIERGKPAMGSVTMTARYEESHIVIDIKDDGRGIDPAKIRAAAVSKGIVTEAKAQAMNDREAINLIMASGFSTAAVVSDISGRGVGMDIVKSNVEKIGGKVYIDSRIGLGSTFTIHLPLTLAIVRALLVTAAGRTYIIPLNSVVEMLSLGDFDAEITRATVAGQAVIIVRGETIPLAGLADLMNGDPRVTDPARIPRRAHIVVVGNGERRVGICVDTVGGELEVVIKSLGALLGDIPGLSGASILGDGRVALIVDVANAIESVQQVDSFEDSESEENLIASA